MKKKVLIIDDSALIRSVLTEIISEIDGYEVVGTALDPYMGAEKIVKLNPDVITLDIEMPKMDGLTFLEKLMKSKPIPVLVVSSLTQRNSETALKALELGAIDYIGKPTSNIRDSFKELKNIFKSKLDMAVTARVRKPSMSKIEVDKKYTADSVIEISNKKLQFATTDKVIAIGASTGGTVALAKLFSELPANLPGIVVVQHMPAGFTDSFAKRLDSESKLIIKEAIDGDPLVSGQVHIAPGAKHLSIKRSGAKYFIRVTDGPLVNRHKPSVDVLFRSVANEVGPNATGVILTGMGDDGAQGLLEMKQAGSFNLAQDEKSSLVFGMPKVAIDKGGVDKILSLEKIIDYIKGLAI